MSSKDEKIRYFREQLEKARNQIAALQAEIRECPSGDALDKLWAEIILKRKPTYGDWEYPGQAYRHIVLEVDQMVEDAKATGRREGRAEAANLVQLHISWVRPERATLLAALAAVPVEKCGTCRGYGYFPNLGGPNGIRATTCLTCKGTGKAKKDGAE